MTVDIRLAAVSWSEQRGLPSASQVVSSQSTVRVSAADERAEMAKDAVPDRDKGLPLIEHKWRVPTESAGIDLCSPSTIQFV